ncbi:MAG: hypothetical protein M1828_002492 [Chrysothrix sp. TS-e1954]|nr:MAG: hypothetical protein M1828_002492 [Chrysothrix sp. TS-e1954]
MTNTNKKGQKRMIRRLFGKRRKPRAEPEDTSPQHPAQSQPDPFDPAEDHSVIYGVEKDRDGLRFTLVPMSQGVKYHRDSHDHTSPNQTRNAHGSQREASQDEGFASTDAREDIGSTSTKQRAPEGGWRQAPQDGGFATGDASADHKSPPMKQSSGEMLPSTRYGDVQKPAPQGGAEVNELTRRHRRIMPDQTHTMRDDRDLRINTLEAQTRSAPGDGGGWYFTTK